MPITLFELAGADAGVRFSPNCWRTRLALVHKGLDWTGEAWRFVEKDRIAATGQGRVPVLVDDGRWLHESWDIAVHLETAHPDRPSLFGGPAGVAVARFVNDWADTVLHPAMFRLVVADVHACLSPMDDAYFRSTREERLGMTLEAARAEFDQRLPGFRQALAPLRQTLSRQPFLGGASPLYADMVVFGAFQWARCVGAREVLENTDPVLAWREAMLDAYGGHARRAPVAKPTA